MEQENVCSKLLLKNTAKKSCHFFNAQKFLEQFMKVIYTLILKNTIIYANHHGESWKIKGVAALLKTYSKMGIHTGNQKQSYVDFPIYISKPTCLIHGNGHSS